MQFDTYTFLIFFSVLLTGYFSISDWSNRKRLLLVGSYLFYSAWNPFYLLLILFSTIVDWLLAARIHTETTSHKRRFWLVMSLLVNLGLLGYFKYANFLLDTFAQFMGLWGIIYQAPEWDIILPVGISFYTFQTLSYTIDVYRRQIEPSKSLLDYSLYVGFFPQLVAGPIVRAGHFLPQCETPKVFDLNLLLKGLIIIMSGLFAKVVLSDTYLLPIADFVFSHIDQMGQVDTWIGTLAFSGQIFFDFSGYSLCAIGTAMCLGFALPDNFDRPYGAIGFSDFWKRWHISLSQWIRDYLYIPLGGNRQASYKVFLSLMLTMFLAGLWHGAAWGFIIWGLLHGAFLVIEHVLKPFVPEAVKQSDLSRLLMSVLTFTLVTTVWISFRAENFDIAMTAYQLLLSDKTSSISMMDVGYGPFTALLIVGLLFIYHNAMPNNGYLRAIDSASWSLKGLYLGLLMVATTLLAGGDKSAFIYFQF